MAAIPLSDVLLFPVNWSENVAFRKMWKTSIQLTNTGGETRSALFSYPRRGFRYSYSLLSTNEANYLKRKLYKNLHNAWGIPFWMDNTELTSTANSAQNVLSVVSTQYRNFEVGGFCAVLSDMDNYEVREIESFTATSITLVSNLTYSWSTGSYVLPILKGIISSSQNMSYITDTLGNFNLEITEFADPHITRTVPSESFPTYLTYSIFNIKPNFASSLEFTYDHDSVFLQYLGVHFLDSYLDESSISITNDYLFATKEEIFNYLSFFDVKKGQHTAFWLPSYLRDIIITVPFSSTDTTFVIEDIDWDSYWEINNSTGIYLNFNFPDNTEVQTKIISAPASNQITVDTAVGKTITAVELPFVTVSFLYMVRFGIDQTEVLYETDSIAQVKIKFKTVPNMAVT